MKNYDKERRSKGEGNECKSGEKGGGGAEGGTKEEKEEELRKR